jgi:hypothetical protein
MCQKSHGHHALSGYRTYCEKGQEDKKDDNSDTGV